MRLPRLSRILTDPVIRLSPLFLVVLLVLPRLGISGPSCPFLLATGRPCPGCGMTRALGAFAQGDWTRALGLNPFVFVIAPLGAFLAAAALWSPLRSWTLDRLRRHDIGLTAFFWLGLAAYLAFGILRICGRVAFDP